MRQFYWFYLFIERKYLNLKYFPNSIRPIYFFTMDINKRVTYLLKKLRITKPPKYLMSILYNG